MNTLLLNTQLGIVKEMQTEITVVFISCALSKIKFNLIRSIHERMILIYERIYRLGFFSYCIASQSNEHIRNTMKKYITHIIL